MATKATKLLIYNMCKANMYMYMHIYVYNMYIHIYLNIYINEHTYPKYNIWFYAVIYLFMLTKMCKHY